MQIFITFFVEWFYFASNASIITPRDKKVLIFAYTYVILFDISLIMHFDKFLRIFIFENIDFYFFCQPTVVPLTKKVTFFVSRTTVGWQKKRNFYVCRILWYYPIINEMSNKNCFFLTWVTMCEHIFTGSQCANTFF